MMRTEPQALAGPAAQRCPLCGGFNQCTPAQTGDLTGDCWCRSVRIAPEALARIPADQKLKACLCPACAQAAERLDD